MKKKEWKKIYELSLRFFFLPYILSYFSSFMLKNVADDVRNIVIENVVADKQILLVALYLGSIQRIANYVVFALISCRQEKSSRGESSFIYL